MVEAARLRLLLMTLACLALLAALALAMPARTNGQARRLANCSFDLPNLVPAPTQHQTFDNLPAAEQYVCHRSPYPRELRGWQLRGIDAMRWNLPGRAPEDYFWSLNLRFTLGTYSTPSARYLVVMVSNGGRLQHSPSAQVSKISVGIHQATLARDPQRPGQASIEWDHDGLNLAAFRPDGTSLDLGEVLPLLRSME
ncbi:MAG TPA: hypothetical protein VJB57_13325 [Dehalococcoidia bacterium]|nr:hypothetical protein [Dehalococcoidia bacterium]